MYENMNLKNYINDPEINKYLRDQTLMCCAPSVTCTPSFLALFIGCFNIPTHVEGEHHCLMKTL